MSYITNQQIMSKSAEEWQEKARECRHAAYESFERCDTDGFLSQWAANTMAAIYDKCAAIVANDGYYEFSQLYNLEGNPVNARLVTTQYGLAWRIEHEDGTVSWFNPSKAKDEERRRKNNAKKGYFEGYAEFPARVSCGNETIVRDPYSELEPRYTVRF